MGIAFSRPEPKDKMNSNPPLAEAPALLPSEDWPDTDSSCGKSTFENHLVEDEDAPAAREETQLEKEISVLTGEMRRRDEAIIQNSGNDSDGWWYKLVDDIREADLAWVARRETTLAALEEHATSGNFYDRVPYTAILAERCNPRVISFYREEFLCVRQGFSVLRAEWSNTLHNEELKRGHEVREEWERRKDEEKGEMARIGVTEWERKVARDEDLRWERRRLALERRGFMEVVAAEEGWWKEVGEANVENWWTLRHGRQRDSRR